MDSVAANRRLNAMAPSPFVNTSRTVAPFSYIPLCDLLHEIIQKV